MADIKWPNGIKGPLLNAFSREAVVGFIENDLASGPAFVEPLSDDSPTFYNAKYQMTESQARVFEAWLRYYKIRTYSPWFDAPIPANDGETKYQECRYTSGGFPQLSGITNGGVWTYQARLICRDVVSIDDGYEEIIIGLGELGDGNYNQFASDLDIAINTRMQ